MQREQYQTLQWSKQMLDWENASQDARQWWSELEELNSERVDLILKLTVELLSRNASIDDFFVACSYSEREGVQENLSFLDTMRQDKNIGLNAVSETMIFDVEEAAIYEQSLLDEKDPPVYH